MPQVFLIHAHRDPDQVNDLVSQLLDPDFRVFVHLDRKAPIGAAQIHPGARLVQPRIDVHWGDFSQVRAVLHSLAQIVAEVPWFDKVVFLSGQDFPLLPNGVLKYELARLAGHELLDAVPIGPQGWGCEERFEYFHRPGGGLAAHLACSVANRALRLYGRPRTMVNGWQPWGGSSWWALSRDCVQHILRQVDDDPSIARFFRTVACADELFFQTLVMNSRFRERVLANNFRYIQWPATGARNPKVLVESDYEQILASNAHFCRKIDPVESAALLPLLMKLKQSRTQTA